MRRIALVILSAALAASLAHRLYHQFRPVPLYVGADEPIPAELAAALKDLDVRPTITRERPYEAAQQPRLAAGDLLWVRALLAWRSVQPLPLDRITVFSPDKVVAHVLSGDRWGEIECQRSSRAWRVVRVDGPFF